VQALASPTDPSLEQLMDELGRPANPPT
jgi:hypothetical protein